VPGKTATASLSRLPLAGYTFYALAPLLVNASPVFIGLLAGRFTLSPAQMGLLAAIEASGGVVASLTAPYWINRIDWRACGIASAFVMTLSLLATIVVPNFETLIVVRLIGAIFGGGVIYALSVALIGRLGNPDRHFAVGGALQAVMPAVLMAAVPYVRAINGGTLALALFGAALSVAILAARTIEHRPHLQGTVPERMPSKRAIGPAGAHLLASLFLVSAAAGAFWTFAEKLGEQAGLAHAEADPILAIGPVLGIFGAAIAAWLAMRFRRQRLLGCAMVVFLTVLAFAAARLTPITFAIAAIGVFSLWAFLTPFQFGAIANEDPRGRALVLALAAQSMGVVIGPLASGLVIKCTDYSGVLWIAGSFVILAWIAFGGAQRRASTVVSAPVSARMPDDLFTTPTKGAYHES
jgi:predicted MFS family arabinose efflux permease